MTEAQQNTSNKQSNIAKRLAENTVNDVKDANTEKLSRPFFYIMSFPPSKDSTISSTPNP